MTDMSDIVAWLDDGAPDAPGPRPLMQEVCSRLAGAGIPLERAAIFVAMLHPEISGLSAVWRRGELVELSETPHDFTEAFIAHPIVGALRTGMPLRRKLGDTAIACNVSILGKLQNEGFTDYLATPLRFTNGEVHIASWATRQPTGFTDEDLETLAVVAQPLARLVEIRSLRRTEATLLGTYLGRQASARVLSGHIRRGDTESIHAAIWLSDLRGFTSLAERLPPRKLTALLNRYFDCQVPIIEGRGGEVLKFMGDGLLAIFPTADLGPERVCTAAFAAAREARANILALERKAAVWRSCELPFSLALHVGDVLYGNVGGGRRLDFTVIGPAINLTARLERLARELDRSVITSAEFAAFCGEPLVPLGSYALRGINAPKPAFGLKEETGLGAERA